MPKSTHDRMIHSLEQHGTLGPTERRAIASPSVTVRDVSATSYLVREGQRPERCLFLLDGFTYRQKVAVDGARALVAIQVPDDFVDIQNLHLRESDHDILALTA